MVITLFQLADSEIEKLFKQLLKLLGENPNREGLRDTPKRMTKAWREWLRAYQEPNFEVKTFPSKYSGMVLRKDIPFISTCEHHMAQYTGFIDFAYIPNGRVIGLSKIPRILQHYSSKLSVQEDLTDELVNKFESFFPIKNKPKGSMIIIKAKHSCESSRGIKVVASTITSALRGIFHTDQPARYEALRLLE